MNTINVVGAARPRGAVKVAVFDFDGTISRIVEDWQELLVEMFQEYLQPYLHVEPVSLERLWDIVDLNTGRKTISQAFSLAEEIKKRGGTPEPAETYLEEYYRRLERVTGPRVAALRAGADPEKYLMPGVRACLEMLRNHGILLAVASGSEETTVRESADLLGVTEFFNAGIFGTHGVGETFRKAAIFENILTKSGLAGENLVGFGDGHIETRDVHALNGLAVGIAFNEKLNGGLNLQRATRLTDAGADWIMADFTDVAAIEAELF